MKKQITNFSVHQSSKVCSCIYFLLAAIFSVPMAIFAAINHLYYEAGTWLAVPFIYLVLSYVMMAIFFFIYNRIAGFVGGIEVTVVDKE